MIDILLLVLIVLSVVNIGIGIFKKPKQDIRPHLEKVQLLIVKFDTAIERMEKSIKEESSANRKETNDIAKSNRQELSHSLENFGNQFQKSAKGLSELLKDKHDEMARQQTAFNKQVSEESKTNREELSKNLASFETRFTENIRELNQLLRQKFGDFAVQQNQINLQATQNVKEVKQSVENQLKSIREDNTKQLGEMRNTVDEKLQKTLNARLSQSFETVGKQLQAVQEGLGEMKTLATDVGGLKKVLSNVKMRGGIGETQLAMLLEQILAPDQYEANVKTKSNSLDLVEFAVKLPGKDDSGKNVWLPIDAKFPKDIYEQLQDAHDTGDQSKIETAQKNLDNTIKKMAGDISDKYIDPPNTTDFGIMFLPFEGIYAEVVRKASLLDDLQRKYKIIVTGPTTLAAILNSLQMGFKTLAIQKRSSEVWQVLGAVKKEFENFGGIMGKAQKNIQTGLNQLDEVMGKRTRAIQRRLKGVEALSEAETKNILPEIGDTTLVVDEEDVDELTVK